MTDNPTRRNMLATIATAAAGASVAALPVLAVASESDPIFAAIDVHRAARAAFGAEGP